MLLFISDYCHSIFMWHILSIECLSLSQFGKDKNIVNIDNMLFISLHLY